MSENLKPMTAEELREWSDSLLSDESSKSDALVMPAMVLTCSASIVAAIDRNTAALDEIKSQLHWINETLGAKR